MHASLAQDRLENKTYSPTFNRTFTYPSFMVAEQPFRSTFDGVKEWNLLSLACKDAVGSRGAAWRVITSLEQQEKFKGKEQLVLHAREYVAKVENAFQQIRDGIFALIDKELIPSLGTDELKVFLLLDETGETKSKAGEDACVAYAEATKIAEKNVRDTCFPFGNGIVFPR